MESQHSSCWRLYAQPRWSAASINILTIIFARRKSCYQDIQVESLVSGCCAFFHDKWRLQN
jgi:hypothetical protein